MNESESTGGKWAQNIALFLLAAVAVVILIFWWTNRSGKDKADLAASVQKLYGQIECITPQLNKYSERIDALTIGVAKLQQAQVTTNDVLAGLEDVVYVPRYQVQSRCGCNNGCGSSNKFVKTTPYTAGTPTLEETETCAEC